MPPAFADEAKGTQSVNVTVGDRRVTPLQPAKEKQPGLKVSLFSGESTVIRMPANMPRPGRVELANPTVADVLLLTSSDIYVTGKAPGKTTLALKSRDGAPYAVYVIEVSPHISGLKQKLHEILPNETGIMVTAAQDTVVLSGTVSSSANLAQVLALAKSYVPEGQGDKGKLLNLLEVGGVHQVMLEVRVSEVSRNLGKRLGFNFMFLSASGKQFGISRLNSLTTPTIDGITEFTDPVNMIFRFLHDGATWTTFIDALKDQGMLKVLAEPTLIALSGKSANFLAGGEFPVPIPQASGTDTTITIEYKAFGVGLNFTPTVLSNGKIHMQVAPEVSELDYTTAVSFSGFVVPGITTRRVSTSIELADGQSFAIAGLLKDEIRQNIKKFPLLGDVPVLGSLFRSSTFQKNETELVIIVTPHLVKPLDMTKQTLPTDQFVEPNDAEFYLLGDLEGRGNAAAVRSAGNTGAVKRTGGTEGDFGHIMP